VLLVFVFALAVSPLGTIDPTKTGLGAVGLWTTVGFGAGSSTLSPSFKRFAAGSAPETLAGGGDRTGCVFTASWLKMQ
jgi:hypothetical protein